MYYDVEEEPETVVFVRAIGVKQRNRVRIGREVIELYWQRAQSNIFTGEKVLLYGRAEYMKTLEMVDAVAPLAEYAQDVGKEPVILTVGGKPVAALVAIENADLETVTFIPPH